MLDIARIYPSGTFKVRNVKIGAVGSVGSVGSVGAVGALALEPQQEEQSLQLEGGGKLEKTHEDPAPALRQLADHYTGDQPSYFSARTTVEAAEVPKSGAVAGPHCTASSRKSVLHKTNRRCAGTLETSQWCKRH